MFSGIVDHVGHIVEIRDDGAQRHWVIDTQFAVLTLGESIAVNGICLTVSAMDQQRFTCTLSPETLSVTAASSYGVGSAVNLEAALRVGDRLGGHWVSGHVDGTIAVLKICPNQDCTLIEMARPMDAVGLFAKGSVTVDGVSLTVNSVSADRFSVMLVPHTLANTTLHRLVVGDRVNVEWDHLAKMVAQHLQQQTEAQQ